MTENNGLKILITPYLSNDKEAVLRFCIMNDKRRILILIKISDRIQQDNQEASSGIEKSISTIYKEEGISFEQVFYICIYIILMLLINHLLAFREGNLF